MTHAPPYHFHLQASINPTMASSLHFLLIFLSLLSLIIISGSLTTPFRPNGLVLPVHKDNVTKLHFTKIHIRTPLLAVPFVVDLNGRLVWVNCEKQHLSSTYHAPICHSTQCSRANSHNCLVCSSKARPGCHNNTCGLITVNPVTQQRAVGELAQDVIAIQSIKGLEPAGSRVKVPNFLFVCAPSLLLQSGLPNGVQGVAGLGHTPISLPTQLASRFGLQSSFAMCLSSSPSVGVIFFGPGPYNLLPGVDILQFLAHTPLIISPKGEYHIKVTSIRINQKPVPLNKSLLLISRHGSGGAMISTASPYTTLESSIFKAFTQIFANELPGVPQVKPVAPFGLCFNSCNMTVGRVGLKVPNIDLVLHNENVMWRIFGANSMVKAQPGVSCLGFVDGGVHLGASNSVTGTLQLENNLVQFDLGKSRLGFSSSLLLRRTTCANFNFTAAP